jgi:hypothetical protein
MFDIAFGKQESMVCILDRIAQQSFYEKRRRKTSMEVFLELYSDGIREKVA